MYRYSDNSYDQFYTNLDIAKQCIDSIDITKYDVVIEPSAGNGSFYNQINHKYKIGFDIKPECDGVHKQDFLKYKHPFTSKNLSFMESNLNRKPKILTIGNPPWGVRGQLALEFINHSFKFSDTVAFILPIYFDPKAELPEQAVRPNYEIINCINLPDYGFNYNGKSVSLGSVFITYKKY